MPTNKLKTMLEAGQVGIGALLLMPEPSMVELVGLCGFDYVVFDGEHGVLTVDRLEHLIRACDAMGLTSIVRRHFDSASEMLPWVDTGVMGIMQPHTRSAAQARQLVDGAKYAPIGVRGMGPGRAAAYGSKNSPTDVAERNQAMLAIAQIEDIEAIEHLSEILAVEGIDGCYIGGTDLSHAIGHTGDANHPDVRKLQAELATRVAAAGKWVGFGARDPYDANEGRRLTQMGANLFSFNFVGLFLKSGKELVDATRSLV